MQVSVHRRCQRQPTLRTGFTLLEVVLACVLLSTLVVSTLLATSNQQRKIREAQDRLRATHLADDLLGRWHDSQTGVPLQGAGVCLDAPDFRWQTQVASSTNVLGAVFPVIRLQIYRVGSSRPIFSIDVLSKRALR